MSPGRIRFGALIADPALRTGAKGACDGTFSFDSHVIACNTRRGLYAALATLEIGSFTDANTGTAVGQGGTILRTTDGGGRVGWRRKAAPWNTFRASCLLMRTRGRSWAQPGRFCGRRMGAVADAWDSICDVGAFEVQP